MNRFLLFSIGLLIYISGYAADINIIINVKNTFTNKSAGPYSIRFQSLGEENFYFQYKSEDSRARQIYFIPAGRYFVKVEAEGYQPSTTTLTIDSSINMINFELSSMQIPLEFSSSYIRSRRKEGYTFISGYITSEESNYPVDAAMIRTKDGQQLSITDARGYYEFLLPWSGMENEIIISKDGFSEKVYPLSRLCDGDDQLNNISLDEIYAPRLRTVNLSSFRFTGVDLTANRELATNCITNINVGRNCSCHTCTSVDVVDIETYTKRVLIKEWLSCWGTQTGGLNSLQAGAVAIRSYAMQRVYVPLAAHGGSYNICETTCCQAYGTTQTLNGNTATDNTAKYIMEKNGVVAQTEYAAEQNNHSGCGNCNTGDGSAFACQPDLVCCDQVFNGHGRGMCQNGSARWATGLAVTSSTCSFGASHGFGMQTWEWILNHYYPTYLLVRCQDIVTGVPDINGLEEFSVFPNPNQGQFSIKMKFNSMKEVSFRIFNAFGQLVYQSEAHHISGTQIKDIDTRNWLGGVYLLEMNVDTKRVVKKIIVSAD